MRFWCSIAVAVLLAGCGKPKDTWYDDCRNGQDLREVRVEQLMIQGMDEVAASRTFDFEMAVRNTEIGHRKDDPVQGGELKDAVTRTQP